LKQTPIIESCKLNQINPQAYLTDILGHIADHPIQQIDRLLPRHWKS
jgi:transposase